MILIKPNIVSHQFRYTVRPDTLGLEQTVRIFITDEATGKTYQADPNPAKLSSGDRFVSVGTFPAPEIFVEGHRYQYTICSDDGNNTVAFKGLAYCTDQERLEEHTLNYNTQTIEKSTDFSEYVIIDD